MRLAQIVRGRSFSRAYLPIHYIQLQRRSCRVVFAVSEYVDASGVLHGVANGSDAFTVTLDVPTSSYTFDLFHTLDAFSLVTVNNTGAVHGAGPTSFAVLSDTGPAANPVTVLTGYHTSASFNAATWFAESHDTLTAASGLTQAQINASTSGEGVSSNNFNAGDFLRFDFGALGDSSNGDTWTYGVAPGGPNVSQGSEVTIVVNAVGGPVVIDYLVHSVDGTVTSHVYSGGDGTIDAIGHGNIDFVELYEVSGKSKILMGSVLEQVNNGQTDVPFTVGVTDADGDTVPGSFDVLVNGATTLSGTAGNDAIVGGSANETIIGDAGVDNLTGGGGNNIFQYNNPLDGGGQGSLATITSTNTDTITDFHPGTQANPIDTIAVSAAGFGGGLFVGEVFSPTQVVNNPTGNAFDNSGNQRFVFDQQNPHALLFSRWTHQYRARGGHPEPGGGDQPHQHPCRRLRADQDSSDLMRFGYPAHQAPDTHFI